MYIDYLKNDYSEMPEKKRGEYITRDKKYLGGLIQERVTNDIENIVERWYELNDIGYIAESEKFVYLLKEAEQLYCFSYYTGTIAIIGIASEEYCRYLLSKNSIPDVDKQVDRINKLKDENLIDADLQTSFHEIRKLRNDCIHFNMNFKSLNNSQLKNNALKIIQLYKKCMQLISTDIVEDYDKNKADILKSNELTFREFVYRNRNIDRKEYKIDLQISPEIGHLVFTSQYYVAEIDIDKDLFKEMTLFDMERFRMVIVDLTLPQAKQIQKMKLMDGNMIVATVISKVASTGLTEEYHLLEIHDTYRTVIGLENLDKYLTGDISNAYWL